MDLALLRQMAFIIAFYIDTKPDTQPLFVLTIIGRYIYARAVIQCTAKASADNMLSVTL